MLVREEGSNAKGIWSILFHTFSNFSDGKEPVQRKAEANTKITAQQLANYID